MQHLENKNSIILETEDLFFSYEKERSFTLKKINLKFKKSKVYGIIGSNGSGKSTLIKLIASILKDYNGKIKLYGENLKNLTQKEIAKNIAYLPQEIPEFSKITVLYLLLLSRYPHLKIIKGFSKEDYEIVKRVLKQFKIMGLSERIIGSLSGGERRKILLASLFVTEPEIFVLDEPDSFLDPANKKEIENMLRELKKEGKTIIFTSHSLDFITEISDEIIALKNGKIVYSGKNLFEKNIKIFSQIFNVYYKSLKKEGKFFFYYE